VCANFRLKIFASKSLSTTFLSIIMHSLLRMITCYLIVHIYYRSDQIVANAMHIILYLCSATQALQSHMLFHQLFHLARLMCHPLLLIIAGPFMSSSLSLSLSPSHLCSVISTWSAAKYNSLGETCPLISVRISLDTCLYCKLT